MSAGLRSSLRSLARCPLSKAKRIKKAMELAADFGGVGGGHHKCWLVDQMVRALTGPDYKAWVKLWCDGEDGPDSYEWDTGIAP